MRIAITTKKFFSINSRTKYSNLVTMYQAVYCERNLHRTLTKKKFPSLRFLLSRGAS